MDTNDLECSYRAKDVTTAMSAVAERLRTMAADIDTIAQGLADQSSYGKAAQDVFHIITWGLANTNVERVARRAADADAAVARRDAAQTKEAPRD